MKKFLLRGLQFSLVPLGLCIGLLFLPYDRKAACLTIKDDCYNRSMWIFEKLFHHPTEADLVFFGTSRTTAAINDTLIEQRLNEKKQNKTRVINLGYCRFGQNLQYVFLKELLKHHTPEKVVLEIRQDPDQPAHMHFPYFADGADLISTHAFFHHNYFGDMATGLYYRLRNLNSTTIDSGYAPLSCGYQGIPFPLPFDTTDIDYQVKNKEPDENMWYFLKGVELLKKHQVKIVFLFIPRFGRYQTHPNYIDWYKNYGEVLIPPDSLCKTPCFWANIDHVNTDGATYLSEWLAAQLKGE
ncbi:MAG: hypothetical protein K1X81_06045 [Bacteroidia bacterium]|nr:hypothetical protein [Bacteroidia bacterium]